MFHLFRKTLLVNLLVGVVIICLLQLSVVSLNQFSTPVAEVKAQVKEDSFIGLIVAVFCDYENAISENDGNDNGIVEVLKKGFSVNEYILTSVVLRLKDNFFYLCNQDAGHFLRKALDPFLKKHSPPPDYLIL